MRNKRLPAGVARCGEIGTRLLVHYGQFRTFLDVPFEVAS